MQLEKGAAGNGTVASMQENVGMAKLLTGKVGSQPARLSYLEVTCIGAIYFRLNLDT